MLQFSRSLMAVVIVASLFLLPGQVLSQQWRPIKGGKAYGISGLGLIDQSGTSASFLIVHDNKKKNEGRLAMITIEGNKEPRYSPLNWPDNIELPVDLEALTCVPGEEESSFMALASEGKVYHIKVDASRTCVSVLKIFDLPNVSKASNFEGLALQKIDGKLLAVWAHRGNNDDPAKIHWGLLDLATYGFSQTGSATLKVPWPVKADVRHVSDLKVDPTGVLFISSASDPGDNGPFQSAVYIAGVFSFGVTQVIFRRSVEFVRLCHFEYRKVEALALVPGRSGGMVFATDDENMGASFYLDW
ncbi:MAG: hypothetical protein HWN51_01420 [Desulfobacterales bacterium]|nr:hypothetical protein [Desulfobacterales bacterium]